MLKNFTDVVARSSVPSKLASIHRHSQAELKQHKEEAQRLKAALLDSEAAVLQKERQIIDMKKQMKEEQRRAEAPLQMDQAVQASPIQHAHLAVQVTSC